MTSGPRLEYAIAMIVPLPVAAAQYLRCTAEVTERDSARNFSNWHRTRAKMEQVVGVVWIFQPKC